MAVDTISEAGERRHEPFRLAGFLVEPKRNRLTGPEGPTSLQPRIIDVLCAFAERPGEVLSRSELIDWVWGVEHGADESLTRAISLLRKVIGDGVIEPIPKRGYRLAAAPQPVAAPERQQPRAKRPLRWMLPAAALVGLIYLAGMILSRELGKADLVLVARVLKKRG